MKKVKKLKKNVKTSILVSLIVILIIIVGVNRYIHSTTEFVYGMIPEEAVPLKFEEIEYTIPTIDEEGNRGTQTFTLDNMVETGQIIKLHVRKDKVRKYEFIKEKDLPETVKNNI